MPKVLPIQMVCIQSRWCILGEELTCGSLILDLSSPDMILISFSHNDTCLVFFRFCVLLNCYHDPQIDPWLCLDCSCTISRGVLLHTPQHGVWTPIINTHFLELGVFFDFTYNQQAKKLSHSHQLHGINLLDLSCFPLITGPSYNYIHSGSSPSPVATSRDHLPSKDFKLSN